MKGKSKKRTVRLLSVLLSAILLIGALPVWSAGAVDTASSAVGENDIRPLDDDYDVPPIQTSAEGYSMLADGTFKLLYDNESNANLPDSFQGVPVTVIGDNAYMGRDITWAIIPGTVTTIGDYAFADCKELNEAVIPPSVISIGEGAFDGCPNLRLKVGYGSVAENYALNNNIPYTVQSVSDYRINSVIYNSKDADVYFFDSQGTRVNLTRDVDYTMDYTYDADKQEATLVIRGKGMYTGEYIEKQQIGGRFPIGNQTLELSEDTYEYDGTAKTPYVTVYFECPVPVPLDDDREPTPFEDELDDSFYQTASPSSDEPEYVRHYLVKDRDYTVSYRNNINTGLAEAVVTGKGFYTGSTVLPFTISGKTFDSSSVSLSALSYTYDGTAKTPAVTVRASGRTLTQNIDYTVEYQNNINSGTATVKVTGKGNYGGNVTKSFTINKCSLSGASTVLSGDSFIYDGSAKRPTLTLYINGKALKENTDYTVSYANNTNVGTATVTATGKGNYQGTVSKSYTIKQNIRPIADCTVTLSNTSYTYDGSAKTPSVTVKYGSSALTANTDYTVSYSGNINAGKATVTVTGKGNYTGTKSTEFTIQPKALSSAMIRGESTGYIYEAKRLTYRCTVSDGGKALSEGTDYTLYCDDNFHAGQATAKFTGKGNYTGTVTNTYTISPLSIDGAAFGIPASYEYDGTPKQPQVKIVYKNGIFLSEEGVEFTVSYKNNVLPGTATVTVTGIGDFTGSSSRTFTITNKTADQFVIELASYSYTYDGTDKQPTVTVKEGKTALSEGTHYTVSYSNCRNAGTATATVTGKGIYSGSKSVSYTISPRHISYATARLSQWRYTYDGTPKTPGLTLDYNNTTLRSGTDYTYSYKDNTAPGTGTVKYYGKGNWFGDCFEEFEINKPVSKFTWGVDNWSFNNWSDYFSSKYYINDNILKKFQSIYNLPSKDIDTMLEEMKYDNSDGGFGGSCYGMTTSEMMAKYGTLDVTRFGGNSVINKNSNTSSIISLINCFQYAWSSTDFNQTMRTTLFSRSQSSQADMVKFLESRLKNGDKMVNVDFWIKGRYTRASESYKKGDIVLVGGHSILAYGVESITPKRFTETGSVLYDKRILIADPNALKENRVTDDCCIYYRSSDYSWIIPHYTDNPSTTKLKQWLCYWTKGKYTDSTKTGYLRYFFDYKSDGRAVNLMSETNSGRYVAGLDVYNSNNEDALVEQIVEYSNKTLAYSGDDDTTGVKEYSRTNITDDPDEDQGEYYALWNPTADYSLSYQTPSAFSAKMDYKDVSYYADLSNSDHVTFSPSGYVEADGYDTSYNLSLLLNDSECVTDWYKMTVEGNNADIVRLQKTYRGYIMTADNLTNVAVTANNMDVTAKTVFSTDAKSVYIYEIDENTIGVLADMDDNGTYETDLIGDPLFVIGCVSGSGSVSIIDATLIQKYLADIMDENKKPLLDAADVRVFALADVDRDGMIDVTDATTIRRIVAGTVSKP